MVKGSAHDSGDGRSPAATRRELAGDVAFAPDTVYVEQLVAGVRQNRQDLERCTRWAEENLPRAF